MLTGGNVSDFTVADALTADVVGGDVAKDRGCDCDRHRPTLAANNKIPVIPGGKNRKVAMVYAKSVYRLRRRIAIFFGKRTENRRLAVRDDQLDSTFLGFIALAVIKIWLRPNL